MADFVVRTVPADDLAQLVAFIHAEVVMIKCVFIDSTDAVVLI